MIGRNTLTCLMGLVTLVLAQPASAQPRWGRERLPNQGACFYEDANFRGRYFCVRPGERLSTIPRDLGDKISSVRLVGSSEATVYRDSDMRGRSARFISDVRNLKGEGWNDQISSIDVENGRDYSVFGGFGRGRGRNNRNGNRNGNGGWQNPVWGRSELPREGACFYEDSDYRGQYFCAPRGATYTALPRGFNDKISSVRVFGSEVRIFQDSNFRGRSIEIRNDTPDLRGNWRDNVSSMRVF